MTRTPTTATTATAVADGTCKLDLDGTIAILGRPSIANLGRVLLGRGATRSTAAAIAHPVGGPPADRRRPGHRQDGAGPGPGRASLGAELSRVQGHPDLLPSDVTGVSVFSPDKGSWEFRRGPVFAHVVLVDELNRTPPRTQSALLETMEEQQVSVDGQSWPLPRPHMVVATQNPRSQRGTFPLVESQLDRFAIATAIVLIPTPSNERSAMALHQAGKFALDGACCRLAPPTRWWHAQRPPPSRCSVSAGGRPICRRPVPGQPVRCPGRATGSQPTRRHMAHPVRPGPCRRVRRGVYVTPGDVKAVAVGCLAHRILTDEGDEHLSGRLVQVVQGHSRGDADADDRERPDAPRSARLDNRWRPSAMEVGGHPRRLVAGRPQQRRRVGADPRRRGFRDARHRRRRSRLLPESRARPGRRRTD